MSVVSDHGRSLCSLPRQRRVKRCACGKQFNECLKAVGLAQLLSDIPELQATTLQPPQWSSQHSLALSEVAVKCTVKRRDGELHLVAKMKLTQQTAQFSLSVISSMITSMSATFTDKEFSNKGKSGPGLLKWLVGKDDYPGSSMDFSSLRHMHALLLSSFKASFSSTSFPVYKGPLP